MKRTGLALVYSFYIIAVAGQNVNRIDTLKNKLPQSYEDTNGVKLYLELSRYYNYKYPDTVLYYASKGLELARKLNFKRGEINMLNCMGEAFNTKGNYPKALQLKLEALREAEKINDPYLTSSCQNYLAALYSKTGDHQKALSNYFKAKANEVYFKDYKKYVLGTIGLSYFDLNKIDSAYYYGRQSYELDIKDQDHWTVPYYLMAAVYNKEGNGAKALEFYRAGNQVVNAGALDILNGYKGMASVFKKMNQQDSAIYYAKKTVEEGLKRPLYSAVLDASSLLTDIYKSNQTIDSAFKYQEIMLAAKDSLFSQENVKLIQNLTFNEQYRREQLEQAHNQASREYETKVKLYSLLCGLAVLLLTAFILYRNNRQKQQTNVLLEKKNQEIESQRKNLELTLGELRLAQNQLIQSEKMASLGELTAGIAHEIQNPLNFVNNFSEVNKELIEELKSEKSKVESERDEVLENQLLGDIEQNLEKINQHGKRADSIVKAMLQHSRVSTGQKEPTNINALADEYLRLSYHGMRAKDKEFNAEIKIDFDMRIEKINVIPQNIGRVLLNLYNNAFYAVHEKKKQQGEDYVPVVSVSTKKENDKFNIIVKDNGDGIQQKVLDKIFQPFFTTKPTGQGTGLGLSLSYDIIKAHGGEIKVETKEGEGSEFIIRMSIV